MIVKICGMTNLEDAQAACELGADAVGFIFYPKSPRYITPAEASEISAGLPSEVLRFAVAVNMTVEEVEQVESVFRPDRWQLHGHESIEECRKLQPRALIKAFGLPMDLNLNLLRDYPVEGFLLDKASPRYGGTGETIDWPEAAALVRSQERPVILSGGLNPDNVVQAVKIVEPYGVDVCSGVEAQPGRKDHRKMKEFIELCKSH